MKHKRRHKKTHSRRLGARKNSIDTMNIIGVAVGAVVAGYINKLIPADSKISPKIVAGGKIALGVALPLFVKGGKMKNTLAGVGSGMVAVGTIDLLKEMDILSGVDDEVLEVTLNGDQDILAGDDLSVVNGGEMVLAGDDLSVVNGYDYDEDSY
ncbi:MAG: hypothetical protein WCO54_08825 [Bacteroidota bacterium]